MKGMIFLFILSFSANATQNEIGIYNEPYFAERFCKKPELANASCWSLPTDSPALDLITNKVQESMTRRLPADRGYQAINTGQGADRARNLRDIRSKQHGLYLGIQAYPVKMGQGQWVLNLRGGRIDTWSGEALTNHWVNFEVPNEVNCNDPQGEYGFSRECYEAFYTAAAEELAFALTTRMDINKLDERVFNVNINEIAASLGSVSEQQNPQIMDNDRFGEMSKSRTINLDDNFQPNAASKALSDF